MPGTAGSCTRLTAATCAVLLGGAGGLAAQYRIAGVVLDHATRAPIPGVLVTAPRAPASHRTDAAGQFVLTLAAGTHLFELSHPGYRPVTLRRLITGPTISPLEFVMTAVTASAPTGNPVGSSAASWPPGLGDRILAGGGVFLMEESLRTAEDSSLATLIATRAPTVEVIEDAGRRLLASRSGHLSADRCYLAVMLNGALVWEPAPARPPGRPSGARPPARPGVPPDVDQWNPAGLQAVEIYGAGRVPAEFASPGMHCGAVILWSREGRAAIPLYDLVVVATTPDVAPAVLPAQARVHGTIRDSSLSTPLPLVQVGVRGTSLSATTDAAGRYSLNVPLGFHTIDFRRVGYHPVNRQLRLTSEDPVQLDLVMGSQAQRLDSVQVIAPAPPLIWPPGIEDRKREGFGQFVTDSMLRHFEHTTVSSTLQSRVRGVRFKRVGGRNVAFSGRGPGLRSGQAADCYLAVWLDGILVFPPGDPLPPDLDRYSVVGLEAIEVYSSAQVPAQYRGSSAACGVILLWSRSQRG